MKTVLKAEMLAAMPAMNDASRPVMAKPSSPLGSTSRISSRIALLYSKSAPVSFASATSVTRTPATMPGMITKKGMNIFTKVPMIGVFWAAESESEAIAR